MPLIFFCLQETVSWKPFGSRISLHFIFELKFPAALQVEMLSTVHPQTSQHRFASCSTSKLNTRVDFIIISHCWPAGYRGWKLLSLKTNCIFHRLLWGVLKQSEHHNADYPIEDLCQCVFIQLMILKKNVLHIRFVLDLFWWNSGDFTQFATFCLGICNYREHSVTAHFKDYKVSWAPVMLNKSCLV